MLEQGATETVFLREAHRALCILSFKGPFEEFNENASQKTTVTSLYHYNTGHESCGM